MVRLTDLPEADALHLLSKDCPRFETEPFLPGPPLAERRVAIVTTAGLHRQSDKVFDLRDTSYRVIPGDCHTADLVMSHSSVNYDRTGWQQDVNTVFPLERLRELESAGEIGAVAGFHYALNGAGWEPREIEPTCEELARFLKADGVDAVVVVPV